MRTQPVDRVNKPHSCGLLTPNVAATIDIYVSHLEHMPSIFEQVKQVIIDAKKAGE